jgi:predicted permease
MMQDLKLAIRQLWRKPIFTLSAVLTLAVGMGVNAVAFTVVNGVLFKGTILRGASDAGRILTTPGGDEEGNASIAEYERFRDATAGALDLAAEGRLSVAWQRHQATETAWVLFVSSNYFSLLEDARPIAGRLEIGQAPDRRPSVVIGERFWRRKLNGQSIAGLTLRLNNIDVGVAGVLPESFQGPAGLYSPDVWMPLEDVAAFNTSPALAKRDYRWLFVLGRLRAGASVADAQGRIDAAVAAMAGDWPDSHRHRGARFRLFADRNSELRGVATGAAIAMGIIGLVLLLACFNVANLLLARAVEREREMGIRAAVGAGTGRLVRLVVVEALVIAVLAGGAAFVLASWTQVLVGSFAIPIEQPQHIDLSPDVRVIAFISGLALVAGVLPGLWPAFRAARVDVARVLGSQGGHATGGRPSPLRRWLVGAQVAGSTAFLALAALLAQTYDHLALVDLGFDRERLVVASLEPAAHGYDADRSQRYVRALEARVRAMPGVSSVAVADRVPFFIGFDRRTTIASGAPCDRDDCPTAPTMTVSAGYFRTMGIPLVAGREFAEQAVQPEAIVNQPLARQLRSNRSSAVDAGIVGETLRVGDAGTLVTVVGITARAHTRGLDREAPTLYLPVDRATFEGRVTLVARTVSSPGALVRPIIDAAHEVDENVAVSAVKTMQQQMAVPLWPFRMASWLFSICGALALLLATVGLAGVVIHSVNRRRKEFGVRVSVGATPRDLVSNVLSGSARLLLPGLVAGTLLAAAVARLLQVAFYGVNVLNPLTYLGVGLLECVIVAVACIGPAVRAARVDPLIALRAE